MSRTSNGAWIAGCLMLTTLAACGGGEDTAGTAGDAPGPDRSEAPAVEAASTEPLGDARVAGTIVYAGDIPNLRPISMSADPACEAKHDEPVPSDVLVVGDGNTLGNVFVKVTSGLPQQQFAPPSEPVVIDQDGCVYLPHVVGVMAGQPLKFLNSDGVLHNVHALPEKNREFNMAMPAERTEAEQVFNTPEEMFTIKCDVHPWMNAYVSVMEHPYFATTDRDGRFEIRGLPAGTYELEAWHERLGTRTATVTVADGESATADFTFARDNG